MLIPARCKNVLDPICNFLSTYSEMFQIHPSTAIHLFLSRYRDSSLRSFFFYGIPDLLCMFMVLITDALHIKPAVKCILRW